MPIPTHLWRDAGLGLLRRVWHDRQLLATPGGVVATVVAVVVVFAHLIVAFLAAGNGADVVAVAFNFDVDEVPRRVA